MARIISQLGKVAGAVSSVIAASYGGAVIIRSRNPKRLQVNSVGQVESRAKLKLIGQIAAELAPVIVIPPTGSTSSRNLFIKKNYNDIYCNEDIAQISYENIQITGGMAGLPPIFVQREPSKGVQVRLAEDMQSGVDRVVYIMYKKTIAERLVYVDSVIAHAAGDDKLYPAVLPYTEGDIIILAYGMKDVTANGAVKYGETRISTAMDVAQLYLRHIKGKKDTIFTMTRGTTLFDGQQESEIVPEGYARVFVTAFGDGSVSGAGVYRIGDMVTITATPDVDYEFVGWMLNGSEEVISTDAQYKFVLTGQMDLVAKFEYVDTRPILNVRVTTRSPNVSHTEPTGNVKVRLGDSITIKCVIDDDLWDFRFWRYRVTDNNEWIVISYDNPFVFTPAESCQIMAYINQK